MQRTLLTMIKGLKSVLITAKTRVARSRQTLVQRVHIRFPRVAFRTPKRVMFRSPMSVTYVAFLPALLFLTGMPMVAQSDDLQTHVSPREYFVISGKAKTRNDKRRLLPDIARLSVKQQLWMVVTAYSSTPDQTDSDPFTTASGTKVRHGIIAHNGLPFGTKVRFPDAFGDQVFVVQDRMNARYGSRMADLWMPSRQEAKQWGVRRVRMEVLNEKRS